MTPPRLYPLLVADAGNSSAKFAVVARSGAKPRMLATVASAALTPARVRRLWKLSGAASAAAASVVPRISKVLRAGCPGILLIGPGTVLNFPAVIDRRTAGADRLANMAEAARRHGENVLVADFGTAATFDLLDARGCFAGGAIAPGLGTLSAALTARTAQLPAADLSAPRRLAGRNTREALRAGVAGGYAGLARHLVAGLAGRGTRLVFTGGDAAKVRALTGLDATVDPLWTLRGIAALAEMQGAAFPV